MVYRPSILLLILYLSLAAAACTRSVSEVSTDVVSTPFPPKISKHQFQLFIADTIGNKEQEIIFASSNNLLIYNLGGHLIKNSVINGDGIFPSLITDADGDSKVDIVFGANSSGKNEIRVYNGLGYLISSFSEATLRHDFCCLTPVLAAEDLIIAAARPADIESPRGILLLDLFNLNLRFFFQAPDPLDIIAIPSEVQDKPDKLILSYLSHTDGNFRRYGKTTDDIDAEFEVGANLLITDTEGSRIAEHKIFNHHKEEVGKLFYETIGENSEEVLLFHEYEDESKGKVFRILKIRISDGEILQESNRICGRYIESIIMPGVLPFAAVISSDGNQFKLSIFSEDLEDLSFFKFSSLPKLINPLPVADTSALLPVITEEGIITLDKSLNKNKIKTEVGICDAAFIKTENRLLLITQNRNGFSIAPVDNIQP